MTDHRFIPDYFANLPGAELVERGLADLDAGVLSENALLVLVAAPRLRGLGLEVPTIALDGPPEHALYSAIEDRLSSGAHSEYNALIQRVVSFAQAADHVKRWTQPVVRQF